MLGPVRNSGEVSVDIVEREIKKQRNQGSTEIKEADLGKEGLRIKTEKKDREKRCKCLWGIHTASLSSPPYRL
jgi:hypothetical protein